MNTLEKLALLKAMRPGLTIVVATTNHDESRAVGAAGLCPARLDSPANFMGYIKEPGTVLFVFPFGCEVPSDIQRTMAAYPDQLVLTLWPDAK